MKQALIKKGSVIVDDIVAPKVSQGSVLIKVVNSCISAGTELSGLEFSGHSLIRQALEQPQKVVKALNMMRTEGIARTVAKIHGHFETGSPTGYSAAGIVIALGDNVSDLRIGDHVAAAGAGYANHAEYIDVPRNLVMRIPKGLDFECAATVTLGGIAMQGVRRASPKLGEYIVVLGVGILGMLALRMCVLSGARVIAIDIEDKRLKLAKELGAELVLNSSSSDLINEITNFTDGHLADKVIFCAATNNSSVLSDAFSLIRRKGMLIMVGVWGKELKRDDIYKKEIDFHISTSYGPGRYDAHYEEGGVDYPYDYVRWTENRNMTEYLRLLASESLNIRLMIHSVFPIEQASEAYTLLQSPEKPMIVLLDYGKDVPQENDIARRKEIKVAGLASSPNKGLIRVGIVGAGGYAQGMHLPNLKKLNSLFQIHAICSRTGTTAQAVATQYEAKYATTDYDALIADKDIDLIIICTRHNLHGGQVLKALQAGKHVLVEKPLCINNAEFTAIEEFYANGERNVLLAVGFNRRFSKYINAVREAISKRTSPLFIRYRMNAGYLPPDHWTHGLEGGGRIIGEGCHIVDLTRSLTQIPAISISTASLHPNGENYSSTDNKLISIEYEDGSIASIEYLAIGSSKLPKEYLEVHFDGKSIIMDNYQALKGYGLELPNITDAKPDKGQLLMLKEIGKYIKGERKNWPISLEELFETTQITFTAA